MKKHLHYPLATIVLLLISMHAFGAQSNCVYDGKNLSDSRFKGDKKISKYTWDKVAREAKIITNDSSLVSIKYWACEHYGVHATMLLVPTSDDLSNLGKKFVQLADLALEANEATIVKKFLLKNPVSLSEEKTQIRVPNTGYSEFYLGYGTFYDSVVLEIKFYRD